MIRDRQLREVAEGEGLKVLGSESTGSGHIRLFLRAADGTEFDMVGPCSLSDSYRGLKNFRCELRRKLKSRTEVAHA